MGPKNVHIWRVSLNKPGKTVADCEAILTQDEIKRADRFHFDRDRRRYIVKQASLRIILGEFYLDCEPRSLKFGTSQYGKPYLTGDCDGENLCFNMSDSNELALIAFTSNSKVGIDVEFMRAVPDASEIAARSFSKAENIAFQALPQAKKQEAFFNCWTRKEAFIKAIGKGLSDPLDRFEVSLEPGKTVRLISIKGDPQKADEWSLISMTPEQGYLGALAIKKKNVSVTYWTYPD